MNNANKKTYGSEPLKNQPVVFVNGIVARNLKGLLWLWSHFLIIRRQVRRAQGCAQVKAGICAYKEVVMVTYWQDEAALNAFVKDPKHKQWMQYFFSHHENITFYNERYTPTESGRYAGPPHGLALFH